MPDRRNFKSPTVFNYYNAPSKTAESRSDDGSLNTVGDVGYVDDEGYLFLTDRKSFMIISGGVNIYPQEAENVLIEHPKVLAAPAFGAPTQDLGEGSKAFVQRVGGAAPSREL